MRAIYPSTAKGERKIPILPRHFRVWSPHVRTLRGLLILAGLSVAALPFAPLSATPKADERLAAEVMDTQLELHSASIGSTRLNVAFLKPTQWVVRSEPNSLLIEPDPNPFDVGVVFTVGSVEQVIAALPFAEGSQALAEHELEKPDGSKVTVKHHSGAFPDRRPMQFWSTEVSTGAATLVAVAGASDDVTALYEPILKDILASLQVVSAQ